jgi:hypothetical protein
MAQKYKSFEDYIMQLREEMRRCLHKSEEARDQYYRRADVWKEKGFAGVELDIELRNDYDAQKALADENLYSRWAQKYSGHLVAELAARTYLNEEDAKRSKQRWEAIQTQTPSGG